MRFMVIVKATEQSEAGQMPSREMLEAMQRFNEGLVAAGRMLAGDGLHASAKGARISFSGGDHAITPGPFEDVRALVSGFWIIEAASLDEAVDLMKHAPFDDGEIEIRQIVEAADFGDAMTPELRAAEQKMAADMAARSR
jgi:hypothetical protein